MSSRRPPGSDLQCILTKRVESFKTLEASINQAEWTGMYLAGRRHDPLLELLHGQLCILRGPGLAAGHKG